MTEAAVSQKKRINSIDVLRGIVMVIMVLDHTRDFFSDPRIDPTDLSKVSTALFFTRYITHFCAALFVFLAGTGAFLSLNRGKTKAQAARFLLSRGLWLIVLELTLVNWGFSIDRGSFRFDMDYSFVFLQVIWVIGVSMIVLAGLIYLPLTLVAAIGLILIFGHNAFDHIRPDSFTGAGADVWKFLHVSGMVNFDNNTHHIFVLYPLVPWVGVMAAGYSFGSVFKMDEARRKKIMIGIGLSAIALFGIIRSFNLYGDPNNWTPQVNWLRTGLSFINAQKYPPSLDYLLITLGIGMLVLAALEHTQNIFTNILLVFGRVPLFYYLLHIYLLQLMAAIVYGWFANVKYNFDLPMIYAFWIMAVVLLYYPCRWFMRYKSTHKQWWLSYL